MTQPLIVTQLRAKQVEIETQIASLNDRLAEATADLVHVAATIRLFDPTAADKPATVYHDATKAMRRSDFFALCKAALGASPEPLCTRQLAHHIIRLKGWDADDRRLSLGITHKVGQVMMRFERRGAVFKVGTRDRATVWKLP